MKTPRLAAVLLACLATASLFLAACGKRETRVSQGNKDQILHFGNGGEPSDLDPQTIQGVPEHNIMRALFEGLVMADPKDLSPRPGVAEKWEVSPDGKVYTFYIRNNAQWSNGEDITAKDFLYAYERILNPKLAAVYASNLFLMQGAEEYNKGLIKDFAQVGVKEVAAKRLQITLKAPAPYFLKLLKHYTWFPVPVKVIDKHGKRYDRGNRWTRPENIVGNGPFILKEWKTNDRIVVSKNDKYWDATQVQLKEIHFYPIESNEAEERAFRAGQLHVTNTVPTTKIDTYKEKTTLLRLDPYYGTYFYRINIDPARNKNKALLDPRVRRALSMAIDREALVKNVTRAGQLAAFSFVPPGPADYKSKDRLTFDPEGARKLLAEAGHAGGKGMPTIPILINTDESHKAVAEAIQQMWKRELGVAAEITNQEWRVFLQTQNTLNYTIARYGWIADYADPHSFLEIFRTGNGNNNTGYSSPEFDQLMEQSLNAGATPARLDALQKAESVLLRDLPVIPIYFYTRNYLISGSVRGWTANLLDDHVYKYVSLDPNAGPDQFPAGQ
ncbi:MAG: peptide ABC transporter substrate-binding protein [Verrucomicrobia bacterium]|nr:peptide ABC transporter substrate-binding protein [Verrucomicrobiota bacterium]